MYKRNLNVQQVSETKKNRNTISSTNEKSARYKFQVQNQCRDEKNEGTSFTKRKINMEQVS